MATKAKVILQQRGNSLAIRLPAAVARSARLVAGQPVELTVGDEGVLVRAVGRPRLTLTQRLALFDPDLHGGEVMMTGALEKEAS